MPDRTAEYWIEKLKLEPHPEGGYFRQTYRSDVLIPREALPAGFQGRSRCLDCDLLSVRRDELLRLSPAEVR